MLGADRTSVPRPAALVEAIGALSRLNMPGADSNVIAFIVESADRTRRQARLLPTGYARAHPTVGRRRLNPVAKHEGAAPGMPKTPVGMNEHSDRRRINRFRHLRPANERRPGRPAEWEDSARAKFLGEPANHTLRPAVQRIWGAVTRFRRGGELRPMLAPDKADEHNCSSLDPRSPIVRFGMKGAAKGEAPCRYRLFDPFESHIFRRYWPPTSNKVSLIWPSEHTRTASISTSKTFSLRITA